MGLKVDSDQQKPSLADDEKFRDRLLELDRGLGVRDPADEHPTRPLAKAPAVAHTDCRRFAGARSRAPGTGGGRTRARALDWRCARSLACTEPPEAISRRREPDLRSVLRL